MHARKEELGIRLTLFVAIAMIVGAVGAVMSIPSAIDGEWSAVASLALGVLGITAGVMIWTGGGTGTIADGMNIGTLWALLHLPYIDVFDRAAGTDMLYPIPAIGAVFSMGSSRSVNGELMTQDVWGIGLLGLMLLILASLARKDWMRLMMKADVRRNAAPSGGHGVA